MARPRTTRIDYFPFDVDFESDPKVRGLKARYGALGVYVYIHLLCAIYREGYFIPFTDDDIYIIADDLNLDSDTVTHYMDYMLTKDLFDSESYKKYNVLTSKAIQKRWQEAVKDRARTNKIVYDVAYWLLSEKDTEQFIHSEFKPINSEFKPINSEFNHQSKVKESKVNKSKVYKENFLLTEKAKESQSEEKADIFEDDFSDFDFNDPFEEEQPKAEEKKTETKPKSKPKPERHIYGEAKNVLLTDREYELLKEKCGEYTDAIIDYFSDSKACHGYTYKEDYRAILNWGIRGYYEQQAKEQEEKPKSASFTEEEAEKAIAENMQARFEISRQRQAEKKVAETKEAGTKSDTESGTKAEDKDFEIVLKPGETYREAIHRIRNENGNRAN